MADLSTLMTWTFYEETQVPTDIYNVLVDGENPEVASRQCAM